MIAVMAGKVALGMIEAKPVIDVTGKVMGTLVGILFIRIMNVNISWHYIYIVVTNKETTHILLL